MKKIIIKDINFKELEPSVSCIGFFDGVHKGHQKLINKAIQKARKYHIKSSVICFDPDPGDIIKQKKNKHLTSIKDRLNKFEEFGVDQVIIIKFTKEFMSVSAFDFIDLYLNRFNLKTLVCGFDYSFGYLAKGDSELLKQLGKFKTIVIKEHKLLDKKISSTRIREELFSGNFKLVNRLLGYDYYIDIKVINVSKNGSNWLIKSKPIDKQILLPKENDYKRFMIKDNCIYFNSDVEYKINEVITFKFI